MQESCMPVRTRTRATDWSRGSRTERFLLQDEENGVDELEVLEIVVDNIIEF